MRRVRAFAVVVTVLGILIMASQGHAVIFKYLDARGEPTFVDDLAKVPDAMRDKAVIVTGKEELTLVDDAERARALAAQQASAQQEVVAEKRDSFVGRLLRSGVAAAVVVAVLFVIMNFDALKERIAVVRKVRIALIAGFVLFVGFTHAPDVMGLFRTVSGTVPTPLADIKDRQAAKGKQAAEAYKNIDRALQGGLEPEADRIQQQIEQAESGR